MGKAKNETVAKYHAEYLKTYYLMLRRDEDEALLQYIEDSDLKPSELFRRALREYMKGVQ